MVGPLQSGLRKIITERGPVALATRRCPVNLRGMMVADLAVLFVANVLFVVEKHWLIDVGEVIEHALLGTDLSLGHRLCGPGTSLLSIAVGTGRTWHLLDNHLRLALLSGWCLAARKHGQGNKGRQHSK